MGQNGVSKSDPGPLGLPKDQSSAKMPNNFLFFGSVRVPSLDRDKDGDALLPLSFAVPTCYSFVSSTNVLLTHERWRMPSRKGSFRVHFSSLSCASDKQSLAASSLRLQLLKQHLWCPCWIPLALYGFERVEVNNIEVSMPWSGSSNKL